MPIGKQNLSSGFIQLRTPARINICSVIIIMGGRLALQHHRSFSATSFCWL